MKRAYFTDVVLDGSDFLRSKPTVAVTKINEYFTFRTPN